MMAQDGQTSPRVRGSYAKSAAVRETIVDAALEVFAAEGYRSGSLRSVATRAGMSETGLLHHFPSKTSLLRAVLERREEITAPFLPDVLGDPEAAVRGILELTRHNAALPGRVELFATISSEAVAADHPAHEYIVERYAAKRRLLVAAFGELADAGLLREGVDPESAARWSVAMTDGLQLQWLLDRASVDMVAEVRAFLRRITLLDL
jgi:AcrR family transcriptional regulator